MCLNTHFRSAVSSWLTSGPSWVAPPWPGSRRAERRELHDALDQVLAAFGRPDRQRLWRALRDGGLARRVYVDADGRGCILNVLNPALRSRTDRRNFFAAAPHLLEASERLVIGWDSGELSDRALAAALRRANAVDRAIAV